MSYRIIILFICIILNSSYIFSSDISYEGKFIKKINIYGLINADKNEVKNKILLRERNAFYSSKLNETIKNLYKLGYFQDISANVLEEPDGLVLNIELVEKWYIKQVKFRGNIAITRENLVKEGEIDDGYWIEEGSIKNVINKIKRYYHDSGYYDVDITFKIEPINYTNKIFDLVINIIENKKIVIEKIVITGNNSLSANQIKSVMKNKEAVFIIQSGVLKRNEFEMDKERVKSLYEQNGYIDVKFNKFDYLFIETNINNQSHKYIQINIDIDEGIRYNLGKISIKNNIIYSTEELTKFINVKEGEIFNRTKIETIRYNIYNKYSDNGYLYASITPFINKDTNTRIANVDFIIFEGPRTHIQNISISGNYKTKDKVIKRELLFEEGELYIQKKVRASYESLMRTEFFSEINFLPNPGSIEGLIDLDIEVKEQSTGLISGGGGLSSESGLNFFLSISEKNFLGLGQFLSGKLELGEKKQILEFSFKEPYLFDIPLSVGFSLSFNREVKNVYCDNNNDGLFDGTNVSWIGNTNYIINYKTTNNYSILSISASGNIGRRLSDTLGIYSDFGSVIGINTWNNFTNPLKYENGYWTNDNNLISNMNIWKMKNYISGGLSYSSIDNVLNPTKGQMFMFTTSYIGGILGGDYNYIKLILRGSAYFNPFWKFVIGIFGTTELLQPQFDGRFNCEEMLGFDGSFEMRGWLGYSKFGNSKLFLSTEFRIPFFTEMLTALTFFDLGNNWIDNKDYLIKPDNMIFSTGIGLRINFSMIPLRFYLTRKGKYDITTKSLKLEGSDTFFDFSQWTPAISIQGILF